MKSRIDIIGQNGNTGAHYILDKDNWRKDAKIDWWKFDKYSIYLNNNKYVAKKGAFLLGVFETPEQARERCGLDAGVIE